MSDRKFVRGAMRAYARNHGIKESKYVHDMFDRLQVKRWGRTGRRIHQAIGTKSKHLWDLRINVEPTTSGRLESKGESHEN